MTPTDTPLSQAAEEAAVLDRALADLEARGDAIGEQLTRTFANAIISGKSLDDVLKGLALKLSGLALNAGLKPLENMIGQAFSGMMSGAKPFASGGVVAQPTYFAHAGGTGLMGEAGAEAILPLKRGSDGTLGVATTAAAAPVIHFHVTATDADSFRRSEAQIAAMLARTVRRGSRHL